MTEELLNALKLIKAECEKHPNIDSCCECPMRTLRDDCGVTECAPIDWILEKKEVYF